MIGCGLGSHHIEIVTRDARILDKCKDAGDCFEFELMGVKYAAEFVSITYRQDYKFLKIQAVRVER